MKAFSKRVQGCRLVMFWSAIPYKKNIELVGVSGRMNAKYYINLLQRVLMPAADPLLIDDWTLQRKDVSVRKT